METIPKLVKIYQCPGCISNPEDADCYLKSEHEGQLQCTKHCPGTLGVGIGKLMPGFPKGFNRVGYAEELYITIFKSFDHCWKYDKFNIPVWKYYDKDNDATLIKGLSPRICMIFLHIISGDVRDKINCLEITKEDIEGMD
ncbi:MAG: hypothetical protein ACP6IQ_02600 [Candidatus Njordarchaeia archaeon]